MNKKEERDLIFQPNLARIERILPQIANHRMFQLRFVEEDVAEAFSPAPGQFIELSVPGSGKRQYLSRHPLRDRGLLKSASGRRAW
jgi:NAD(P)H-flavin reductase